MHLIVSALFFALFSSQAQAQIKVLNSGTLYSDEAASYGNLNGTYWYSISGAPANIKKIKLQTTPDPENAIAPAILVPEAKNLIFYVNGVVLKEGPVKNSQENIVLKASETALNDGVCSVFYKSSKIKTPKPEDFGATESRDLFVKCKGVEYLVNTFKMRASDMAPSIDWAGDLNGDGIPELKVDFDPSEKGAPATIYFSETVKDKIQYIIAGHLQYQGC